MYSEINIDCISGPTHNFGGLSFGNIASLESEGSISYPKKAALQGLEKMRHVFDLNVPQLILPPHHRPDIQALQTLGFRGSEQAILEEVYEKNPALLLQISSSSFMWMANAATVSPSCDTKDKKLHFTIANLGSNFHRSLEVATTTRFLQKLFPKATCSELPSCAQFFDEGAANHTRFTNGLHLFVHGPSAGTKKYPCRQTRQAQEAIVRQHQLQPETVIFAEQNPEAIDAGVFHNDVISTGFETLFLYHEKAFVHSSQVIEKLKGIHCIQISERELSLQDAVKSYFFNSQIVRSNGKLILLAPEQCRGLPFIQKLDCFDEVQFIDLHESMKNGGGPACLRLRVQLNEQELHEVPQETRLSIPLYEKLRKAIETHYPDTFTLQDLLKPEFRAQSKRATDTLHKLLGF